MSFSRISNLQCPKEYVYKNEPVAESFFEAIPLLDWLDPFVL